MRKGSKALYARFKANVEAAGLDIVTLAARTKVGREHIWYVLTGRRVGSAKFWAVFGPWCAPRPRVGRDGPR